MSRLVYSLVLLGFSFATLAQSSEFTGKVSDRKKEPVAGATIHLLNTQFGAVSDAFGNFKIPSVPTGTYTIQIIGVGYASIEKLITVNADMPATLQIELAESLTQLDDVIVTAQKKEEGLQRIAASISSLSTRQIQEYRIWNSQDITAIVPNLYSSNPGDGRNVTSIRGITSTSYDPSVATYIDGVNQFGLDTYIAQLFDVERIEVLRGPQGTLYGRNAMGGVINIITKQPSNTTNGFAEVNFGSYGQQRYTAAFRTPLIKDKLFFGASAVYDHNGGFYTNQFNTARFDNRHSLTGNYYLKYLVGQRWALTYNLKHNANRNFGAFPLNYQSDALSNPFQLNQNGVAEMMDNVLNTSLSASYSGTRFNFSSQTAYQSNYRYYKTAIDADFLPLDAISIVNNYGRKWNTVKVITQELKFTSPAGSSSPFQWTSGAYFFYQSSPVKQGLHYGKDAPLLGLPDSLYTDLTTTRGSSAGSAFFGQGSYSVARNLSFTAGLRYDYEHKKQSVSADRLHDNGSSPEVTRSDTSATVSFHALSPKFVLAWQASDENNLFVSWSRGYRTGGLTPFSLDPTQRSLFPFQPEFSSNFEAGSKNTFINNHLRANLSLFYITVTNAQIPLFVVPYVITSNAGTLSSKGMELELSANPVKALQADYNLGINNARFKNAASNGDYAGKHQIFTPPITSMLALQYSPTISKSGSIHFFIRGEWRSLGRNYFNYTADPIAQSPINLFNARIGIAGYGYEIAFWGRNLSNKKYIDYAYDFGAVHLANPRNYGVTLRKNF